MRYPREEKVNVPLLPKKTETAVFCAISMLQVLLCPPPSWLQGLSLHHHPDHSLPQVILTWCKFLLLLVVEAAVGRQHYRNNGDLEGRQSTVNIHNLLFLPPKSNSFSGESCTFVHNYHCQCHSRHSEDYLNIQIIYLYHPMSSLLCFVFSALYLGQQLWIVK